MKNRNLFPIEKFSFVISNEKGERKTINVCDDLVKKGLQYSNSYGIPETLDW